MLEKFKENAIGIEETKQIHGGNPITVLRGVAKFLSVVAAGVEVLDNLAAQSEAEGWAKAP